MSLADKLDEIRAASATRIPEEKRAVMGRATQELRESGILDQVIRVGDGLPPFALPNQSGAIVSSDEALARGPMVLTVFRGSW